VAAFHPGPDLLLRMPAPEPPWKAPRWLPWTVVAAGAAATTAGGALGLSGHMLAREARSAPGDQIPGYRARIDTRNRAALITSVAGMTTLAVGIGWVWWTAHNP
jgi:hypothetical protein